MEKSRHQKNNSSSKLGRNTKFSTWNVQMTQAPFVNRDIPVLPKVLNRLSIPYKNNFQ